MIKNIIFSSFEGVEKFITQRLALFENSTENVNIFCPDQEYIFKKLLIHDLENSKKLLRNVVLYEDFLTNTRFDLSVIDIGNLEQNEFESLFENVTRISNNTFFYAQGCNAHLRYWLLKIF